MSQELRHFWSPSWAQHVVGTYSDREQIEGEPPDQRWAAECRRCKAKVGPIPCTSGAVKRRIAWWAASHVACKEAKG